MSIVLIFYQSVVCDSTRKIDNRDYFYYDMQRTQGCFLSGFGDFISSVQLETGKRYPSVRGNYIDFLNRF